MDRLLGREKNTADQLNCHCPLRLWVSYSRTHLEEKNLHKWHLLSQKCTFPTSACEDMSREPAVTIRSAKSSFMEP